MPPGLTGSSRARQYFEEDGFYIHAESVLPMDILISARRGMEDVRNGVYDTGEQPDGRLWNPGDDPQKLCKIEHPQLGNAALRRAIRSSTLGEIAARITGARCVQVWWVQGLYKPGAVPSAAPSAAKVGWHQDKNYWSDWEDGSELFTAWLALTDVTAESGPMVFIPGSHLWGLLPGSDFFAQDQDATRARIPLPAGESWREVADILPPGGVSFHNQFTFHGSNQNVSSLPRISLALHLRTENSRPKPDTWVTKYLNRPEICPVIFDAQRNAD